MPFAVKLKAAREAAGLSVRELADLVGLTRDTIFKYERGDRWPSEEILAILAKKLKVRPAELVD